MSNCSCSFLPRPKPKKPYPLDFSECPPTPNHNPMISDDPITTFHDIQGVLKLLQHLTLYCEQAELKLDVAETRGLMCLIECALSALEYELDHRPAEENENT